MKETIYSLRERAEEMLVQVFPEAGRRMVWLRNNFIKPHLKDMDRVGLGELIQKLEPLTDIHRKLL